MAAEQQLERSVLERKERDELRAIAAESGIQVFQLHGDEPPDLCARLPLPVGAPA